MRVRLRNKLKPGNCTESRGINVADRWRERNVWYPGRPVRNAPKEGATTVQGNEAVLSAQESAEVIVVRSAKVQRAKDRINRSL